MGYIKANEILPPEILTSVQRYVDGQMLYIPRKTEGKRAWGTATGARKKLESRNACMYAEYQRGSSVKDLAEEYFLTEKSVQRIIRKMKPSDDITHQLQEGT